MTLDAYGKIIRVGDRVHRLRDKRTVRKGKPGGRVMEQNPKTFRVRGDENGMVKITPTVYESARSLVKQ